MCDHHDTIDLDVVVPARLSHTGRERRTVKPVDRCLAPIVEALNANGILTAGACCGHGRGPGEIALHDGRWLVVVAPGLAWWRRVGVALAVLRLRS